VSERTPVLVLGLGNAICGDDGAGIAAVHQLLREWELPEGVLAVDGGTLGLSLLPLVDSADQVILIDAIRADGPVGSMVRIDGDEVAPAVYERLSVHQIGVADLLNGATLLDRYPTRVVLIGVVPATTDLGLGCTDAVAARIPQLVAEVVEELVALGYPPRPRRGTVDDPPVAGDPGARALGL